MSYAGSWAEAEQGGHARTLAKTESGTPEKITNGTFPDPPINQGPRRVLPYSGKKPSIEGEFGQNIRDA